MHETSPDGVLSVYPENKDQLALGFLIDDLDPKVVQALDGSSADEAAGYGTAGRSAAAQLGMDVVRAAGVTLVWKDHLYIPIDIETYSNTAEAMAEDIDRLREGTVTGQLLLRDEREIQFGRIINYNNLVKLDKGEVERSVAESLIAFAPDGPAAEGMTYRVNDDGSVDLPLSRLEFVFNQQMLRLPEQRFNALHHGRAGLIPIMDVQAHQPDDKVPEFMVGGIVFSPGPFYVRIKEQIDELGEIRQLPSGALFDGNRLMGINPRHDHYSRNRQVELVNPHSQQKFKDTWVRVEVYRSTEFSTETLHPVVDWRAMTNEQRLKTHLDGVSPLDVIKATDPASREFLLGKVADPDDPNTGALVISSHGISKVPRGDTPRFMAQNIRRAAESFDRYRDIPEGLEKLIPFVEALKPAADRSRLVVADELELRHIPNIVKSGDVRALLMGRYLGGGSEGASMTKVEHSAIVDLVRQGVSIAWENQGDLREMHRNGLWMTPEAAEGVDQLDLVIAMYGSHIDSVSLDLETSVDNFFNQLLDLVDAKNLGVTHGNMLGLMALADRLARAHGIMSLGAGLNLSGIGQQEANLQPDGFVIMEGDERSYRQEIIDKLNIISIFNTGGFGTFEELFITLASQKNSNRLPAPLILVSEDGLFDGAEDVVNEIGRRGLGHEWVSRTLRLVKNYQEAYQEIAKFWEDPHAFWSAAGLTRQQVMVAYGEHQQTLEQMGMRLAERLKEAALTYKLPDEVAA